eukprot:gene15201-20480_t
MVSLSFHSCLFISFFQFLFIHIQAFHETIDNLRSYERELDLIHKNNSCISTDTISRIDIIHSFSSSFPHDMQVVTTPRRGTFAVMLKAMELYNSCENKLLWGFDSFDGLPDLAAPDQKIDYGVPAYKGQYRNSMENFVNNVKLMNVWNESKVVITKGWFNETLIKSPVEKISFLRLDGDLYISTKDAIEGLYDRVVVPGGFIYVDDYGSFTGCRAAIDEFRSARRIYEPLRFISEHSKKSSLDFEAVWWQKRLH